MGHHPNQALGLDLPIAEGMLDPNDPVGYEIRTNNERVELSTGYFQIAAHLSEQGGVIRTQLELDSRPAFEVLCTGDLPTADRSIAQVMLIQKQRAENAFHAGTELPYITKIPGGYDHSGGGVSLEFIHDRILSETGMDINTNPQNLRCIGVAVGHTEIRTPIGLWVCNRWKVVQEPRSGVSLCCRRLDQALTLADNAVQRIPNAERIENETGVELLYLLDRMLRNGWWFPSDLPAQ